MRLVQLRRIVMSLLLGLTPLALAVAAGVLLYADKPATWVIVATIVTFIALLASNPMAEPDISHVNAWVREQREEAARVARQQAQREVRAAVAPAEPQGRSLEL